jgi:hypothetical protein
MPRIRFITTPKDEFGSTPHGKIIVEGVVVLDETKFSNKTLSNEVCVITRPEKVADRWSKLKIGRDIVALPPHLNNLPVGFLTAEAYASIWTWMWKKRFYECKFSCMDDTMPIHQNGYTWYSTGNKIGFFDKDKDKYIETDDKLLDFRV